MSITQQVTGFDAKKWNVALRKTMKDFLVRAAQNGTDFSAECEAFRRLFDCVPAPERVAPGMPEILNRLASLAQADPKLFDPSRTPHAAKMQDVAIARCSAIMQIIYNGEVK
mgnify:CR=1 FL=1